LILSPITLIEIFFLTLISGPLGEELGWRAYFLTELQKKYNPMKSAIITGIFWGFWHAPLWFVTSGYSGIKLLIYCICFMVYIISFSVIMTLFYNENRNLIIPIIMHQLINYFNGIQKSEKTAEFLFFIVSTVLTFIVAFICVIVFKNIKKKNE
jgi:membrane protease YdiL (CAAX protease family)